jgi:hypothetical protein
MRPSEHKVVIVSSSAPLSACDCLSRNDSKGRTQRPPCGPVPGSSQLTPGRARSNLIWWYSSTARRAQRQLRPRHQLRSALHHDDVLSLTSQLPSTFSKCVEDLDLVPTLPLLRRVVGAQAAAVARLGVALWHELGCDAGADDAAAEALADRLTRASQQASRRCCSRDRAGARSTPRRPLKKSFS